MRSCRRIGSIISPSGPATLSVVFEVPAMPAAIPFADAPLPTSSGGPWMPWTQSAPVPPPGGAKNPDPGNKPGQDGFLFNRFGVRVPCVVVNSHIKKGLIARPEGYVPFDHTSVIKTVQNCFMLTGHLTARDEAAPDFSCLLTLDAPRKADIPEVKPQKWIAAAGPPRVNDLHRVIGRIREVMTGKSASDSENLLEFIQTNYAKLFSRDVQKAAKAS